MTRDKIKSYLQGDHDEIKMDGIGKFQKTGIDNSIGLDSISQYKSVEWMKYEIGLP